jgi:hypothetical protein
MKRKRLISPTGSNIPLVPVEIKNPNAPRTKAEFFAEETRKQRQVEERRQEQELRPLRELQHQSNVEILAERDRQRRWLTVAPSDYLTEHCTHAPTRVNGTPQTIAAEIREAFNKFRLDLEQTGVTLHPSANAQFQRVAEQNPTVDLRVVSNWEILYNVMSELGCFGDKDIIVKQQPVQPVEQQTRPSWDDVEKINISAGSDSERKARKLTTNLMTQELQVHYDRWAQSLIDEFGHYLTEKQTRAACDWFTNNSHRHSPLLPKSWDACRRSLVSQMILPDNCQRPDEREAQTIENLNLSTMSFDEKRALRNRLQRLQD